VIGQFLANRALLANATASAECHRRAPGDVVEKPS
jgi:hypothetical protein